MLATLNERPRVTPKQLRHIEQTSQALKALGDAGAGPALLSGIAFAVDDYMIGHTLRELTGPELDWLLDGFAARLGR